MYVSTFYSYKGGVGRTMALANVAFLLASAGKRVLVVDFDLEAPGLSTYEPFRCARGRKGIVEYVSSYLDTDIAPDVTEYIEECEYEGVKIWLLPAGDFTGDNYNSRLQSINWRELYSDRSGFLLLEDMKQQWAAYKGHGFDYVLIDSRTGHTDVGGICTRQLPDAVVVMFVPTPQNIDGLKPIVSSIRREKAPVRREKVQLVFCPSNVPDLDDEEEILRALIDQAKEALSYDDDEPMIQHYSSIDLLQQPIYVVSHPKSRLSRQYAQLKDVLVSGNLADRDGALIALERMDERFLNAREENDSKALTKLDIQLAQIRATFPEDTDIAWALARLGNLMARPEDELAALDVVVADAERQRFARLRRGMVRATLDDKDGAIEDLTILLTKEPVTLFELRTAVDLLQILDGQGWRGVVRDALVNPDLDTGGKAYLLETLLDQRGEARSVVELTKSIITESGVEPNQLETVLALALIADGQFDEALNWIGPDRNVVMESKSTQNAFNYGYAEWASTGEMPLDLFERVLELGAGIKDAMTSNTLQCFALAKMIVGRKDEALEDIRLAKLKTEGSNRIFSCWRYLTVSARDMLADLDEMAAVIRSQATFGPPSREGLTGAKASVQG